MNYKTDKIKRILERQGQTLPDYESYTHIINFLYDFRMVLMPEMLDQIKTIIALYTAKPLDDVEENFYTCNIEHANIETVYETLQILKAGKVTDKKSSMVIGYSDALKYITSEASIDLLKLGSLITHRDISYRDNSVYVGTEFEVIHQPCDCAYIPSLLLRLKDGFNTNIIILEAILLHYFFVWLHPLQDGNGRCARLLMKHYLYKNGYQLNVSKWISENINGYYKSLKNSGGDLDVTHFIVYMLDIIEKGLSE